MAKVLAEIPVIRAKLSHLGAVTMTLTELRATALVKKKQNHTRGGNENRGHRDLSMHKRFGERLLCGLGPRQHERRGHLAQHREKRRCGGSTFGVGLDPDQHEKMEWAGDLFSLHLKLEQNLLQWEHDWEQWATGGTFPLVFDYAFMTEEGTTKSEDHRNLKGGLYRGCTPTQKNPDKPRQTQKNPENTHFYY